MCTDQEAEPGADVRGMAGTCRCGEARQPNATGDLFTVTGEWLVPAYLVRALITPSIVVALTNSAYAAKTRSSAQVS
jgi:hypothetical protein